MPSLVTSFEPSALVLGLLALAAFSAGWVDAIAGGGGVITVPALLAAGLPPHVALGTNKGQSVFGSAIALLRFGRAGWVDGRRALVAFPVSFIGALLGAQLVLFMSAQTLKPIVLLLLVMVAVFLTVRSPRAASDKAASDGTARAHTRRWAALIALIIGTYDGFFGPGTGTFLIVAHVLAFNESLTHASANAKVVNFASNVASVSLFALRGTIAWQIALPMAVAQAAGSYLGARFAIRGGERVVRPIVLSVVLVLVGKLVYDLLS